MTTTLASGRALQRLVDRVLRRSRLPAFVVGCQRSGTTMLLKVLGRAPGCRVFHENKAAAFDTEFRLRDEATIRRLIEDCDARVIVFKPLLDSQHTRSLLDRYPGARAIWLYRDYRDAVGSAVRIWGAAHRDILWGIGAGLDLHPGQNAVAERLSRDTIALVSTLCDGSTSPENGSLLHWVLRNRFFLELQHDPRVLLVRYEDLVVSSADGFRRVFDFLGCRFSPAHVRDVRRDRIGSHPPVAFDPRILELAEPLLRRLDGLYEAALEREHRIHHPPVLL